MGMAAAKQGDQIKAMDMHSIVPPIRAAGTDPASVQRHH